MSKRNIYRIAFFNQGKVYELYARQISQGGLYGFVEVEELIFGERSGVLVDPSEEKLKDEFSGVKRSFLPMHAILRIDEVESEGVAKITSVGDNVTPFPSPIYTPGGGSNKKE